MTTPLSGTVCHPQAGTYYDQPVYQIWSLCLHPLRIYETNAKCKNWGGFGG